MTQIAAFQPGSEFDMNDQSVLGVLEFHAIPEISISQEDLADMWARHSLDSAFIPRIRPVDAFRRATSAMERTVTIEDAAGTKYEARIEVDDVTKDNDRIVRLLNRKLIDKVNQETPLVTVGKFEFDRASGTMRVYANSTMNYEYNYSQLLFDGRDLFAEYKDFHNRDTLRNVVSKLVRSSQPVAMQDRSQGKFIPRQHIPTMEGLKSFLGELKERAPGQDCSLFLLPMVNCEDLRQTLVQRLDSEIKDETSKLLKDAGEARKKGKLKLEKAQSLLEQFTGLQTKIQEYEQLIQVDLPELRDHIGWAISNVDDSDTEETPLASFDLAVN